MKHSPCQLPLSLYIHVPWCERKCPYCDFNSHQAKGQIDEAAYIDALINDIDADLAQYKDSLKDRVVQTIFIGGGTPSLFGSHSYQRLFTALRNRIEFNENAEITLEANPGSSEREKFTQFRETGINRLSIGVQSFNGPHLTKLGRVHSASDAITAAKFARQSGFTNVNLDLMFGLPEQTIEEAMSDLNQAIELSPTHLSCYQLTIEPNTLFHHNPPITPEDDALWDIQEALQTQLTSAGYHQYEVSAYAHSARQCQHNLNYWKFGDYIGIGAGSHGKITTHDGVYRRWKIKHPASYMKQEIKLGGVNQITGTNLSFEYMLNALRLNDGFNLEEFQQRTAQSKSTIEHLLDKHQNLGLINIASNQVKPTQFGHNMLNNMLQDYLAETN